MFDVTCVFGFLLKRVPALTEPPNFVGTVILQDPRGSVQADGRSYCPQGVPCFERSRDSPGAKYKDQLFVTADKNLIETIWESKIKQCSEQSDILIPMLCGNRKICKQESGYAEVILISLFFSRFCMLFLFCCPDANLFYPCSNSIQGATPMSIVRPTCPNDFYVLGHIALRKANGTISAEDPMPQYKCIHESILRKGTFRNPPVFTGKQPVTSPWNPSLLAVEWYKPLSVWQTDCSYASCGVSQEDTVCTGGRLKKN